MVTPPRPLQSRPVFEIGNSLREARRGRALDLARLERRPKIRGKYLRALEDEQFDQLPAQTYVKGFLRTYAEYLGLDGQLYVDEFNSRYASGEDEPPIPPTADPRAARRPFDGRRLAALVGIAVVTALVIVAWSSAQDRPPAIRRLATTHRTGDEAAARRRSLDRPRGARPGSWVVRKALPNGQAAVRRDARARGAQRFTSGACGSSRNRRRTCASRERQAGRLPAGDSRGRLTSPRRASSRRFDTAAARVVVTGSELVRGSIRRTRTGRSSRARRCARPRAGPLDHDRRRPAGGARGRAPRGARGGPLRHLGRSRADPRRPDGRAARARDGGELHVDGDSRRRSTASRARSPSGSRPYADFAHGRAQAGDACPRAPCRSGWPGTAPALVLEHERRGRGRPAGSAGSCSGSGRTRSGPSRCAGSSTRPPVDSASCASSASRVALVARALEEAGGEGTGSRPRSARATSRSRSTCSRPGGERRARSRRPRARCRHLFAADERPVAELVLDRCRARGLTLATAESCTGGLVAARITEIPGRATPSSARSSRTRTR